MSDTYVLTPNEAAEQTGLDLDTVLRIAANKEDVAATDGNVLRIDPWALNEAVQELKIAA